MTSIARSLSCAALLLAALYPGTLKAQAAATDPAGLGATFSYHLVKLDHGVLVPYATSNLNNAKFIAFYYSASWCPPCRAFTPKLVDFYNQFKPQHANFELVFVNHDNSAADMLSYMKEDAMPWPAARFEDIEGSNANKYCGDGIPDLVLVDSTGKVLSDSFQGSNYLGRTKCSTTSSAWCRDGASCKNFARA